MIEATCSACGTLNRIAEADVPVGAKFVTCASCKSRVPVPAQPAPSPPPIPKPTLPALGGLPPRIPSVPASIPQVPKPVAPPPMGAKTTLPAKPFMPDLPKATGTTNDVIDLADLPAPKRTSALGAEASRPAPKSGLAAADDSDLPAPKTRTGSPSALSGLGAGTLELDDLLAPVRASNDIVDLPAPKSPRDIADLPAPKLAPSLADLPMPKRQGGSSLDLDLPAPKARPAEIVDLPAPKTPSMGIVDLPAPKVPREIVDLPAPKVPREIVDLPMPKDGISITDLPAPKVGSTDLPAPKGFFDNLPSSPIAAKSDKPELPAPKGFFEDLPSASRPEGKSDLPAPKGFFEDLPAAIKPGSTKSDLPAPKGFFEDVPSASRPATRNLPAKPLEGPAPTPPPAPVAPKGSGFFDDIPAIKLRPTQDIPAETAQAATEHIPELDLELAGSPAPTTSAPRGNVLELEREPARAKKPSTGPNQFDDLDLSKPTAPPSPKQMENQPGGRAPAGGNTPAAAGVSFSTTRPANADVSLELEGEAEDKARIAATPKTKAKTKDVAADAAPASKRRRNLIAAAALGVVVLGGGGFFFYQRHAAAQERAAQLEDKIKIARTALAATDAGHWSRAFGAANQAIQLDSAAAPALGLAAEASMAGALDDGVNYEGRIANGRRLVTQALAANLRGPELDRAIALQGITTIPPVTDKLEQMHKAAPKDLAVALYLGWGQAMKGDHAAAVKTFDGLVGTPLKITALYARGRSKLALADLDGATADFAAILNDQRDHIGAMVGLAAALPPAKVAQQESDLDGIIHRKDFASADSRVRILANILLGDDAQRSGRYDVARASYRAALEISPNDISATAGLAETELRDGKIDAAKEPVDKAVRMSPNDARAQLVACEYSIKHGDLDDAQKRLTALGNRQPPLAPLENARLQLLTGTLREVQKDDKGAVEAYILGAKAAGELDLAPTMAAVRVLSRMAAKAEDPKRAAELRDQADQLLVGLAAKAKDDPQLALALGTAYLQSDDAVKAEPLLRSVAEARPKDPEPLFQLGKALARIGKLDDAIVAFAKARALDKTRPDLGFELARAYEQAARDPEAGTLYDELVKTPDLSIELRGRACRYYGRTQKFDSAKEQGDAIAKIDAANPAGLYCRGEGALADKKGEVARQLFAQAVQGDPDSAQYLDAQGRAAELVVEQANETKFQDEALRVYQDAAKHDPKMMNPLVGQGRIYIARKEWQKAADVLAIANKLKENDPGIAYMIGISAQALGQKPGAINWLLVARAKPSADIAWRLGTMYYDLNQVPQAITALHEAIELGLTEEKTKNITLPWLTDVIYTYADLITDEGQKRAMLQLFIGRHPPEGQHKRTAERLLATSLRSPTP